MNAVLELETVAEDQRAALVKLQHKLQNHRAEVLRLRQRVHQLEAAGPSSPASNERVDRARTAFVEAQALKEHANLDERGVWKLADGTVAEQKDWDRWAGGLRTTGGLRPSDPLAAAPP